MTMTTEAPQGHQEEDSMRARVLAEQIEKTDRHRKRLQVERESLCRDMLARGMSMTEIGKLFNISTANVGMIVGRYRTRKGDAA